MRAETELATNDDWLDTSTCRDCGKTARDLQAVNALGMTDMDVPWCKTHGGALDDGACDPSDDECGWCGFPTFDCKCDPPEGCGDGDEDIPW